MDDPLDEELPEAAPARPSLDRSVVVRVAALAFVLGLVLLIVRHHEHLQALQQSFVLAGLALIAFWVMTALVETERSREVLRSAMIGVVGGVAGVGFIGMALLLVS